MTTSAYPATVTALVGIFTAAFPTTGDTFVGDGPAVSDTGQLRRIFVGIESIDPTLAPGAAGTGTVNWATMSTNHSRDEHFSVHCVAVSETGDSNDAAGRRNDAFTLFGAAITALTTDPSIGRPGGVLYLTDYSWTYLPDSNQFGSTGAIEFTLNFRARI